MSEYDFNGIPLCKELKAHLKNYYHILEKFGSFERAMAAENVVHCGECARYNAEKHFCSRPCMGAIFCPPEYYCGSGIYPTNTVRDSNQMSDMVDKGLISSDRIMAREALLKILEGGGESGQ